MMTVAVILHGQNRKNYTVKEIGTNEHNAKTYMMIRDDQITPQTASDSLKLIYNSVALTNLELQRTNNRLRTHAWMNYGALACECIGALCFYGWSQQPTVAYNSHGQPYTPARDDLLQYTGIGFCVAGAVLAITSFIPLLKRNIAVDERGLVVKVKLH